MFRLLPSEKSGKDLKTLKFFALSNRNDCVRIHENFVLVMTQGCVQVLGKFTVNPLAR